MKLLLKLLSAVGLLLGISLCTHDPGEDETDQAGTPIRVDFEGTHIVRKFEPPAPFSPDLPQRLDFEGAYTVRRIEVPEPIEPDDPVRIDFEGYFYKQKSE